MSKNWKPSFAQENGIISRTVDFISEEAEDLRQELNCPPDYIAALLRAIADKFEDDLRKKQYLEEPKLDFYA